MRRANLLLLIGFVDALRRADGAAMRAMLEPGAVWQGLRPEWVCHDAGEIVDCFLERAQALPDVDALEMLADDGHAVLHASGAGLESVEDEPLPDGIYNVFTIEAGLITRIDDRTTRGEALPLDPSQTQDGVPEASLETADSGMLPNGAGWFVLNAADARWLDGAFGAYTRFEGDARFAQVGVNIGVLAPGQPACWYHREGEQEDFLVLAGECVLLIEGEERALRAWDFVHCPAWTNHVFVGAGDGPCSLLALGGRSGSGVVYPVSELALRHAAGVSRQLTSGKEAYASIPADVPVAFDPGWLPGA